MADEVIEFSFDLTKISLDEALDIMDYDETNRDIKYIGRLVKSLRKCLVKGSRELTGADLPAVIQAFGSSLIGGDPNSKN